MPAGDPAQVRSIVTSIKQYAGFKNMAAYNISCLMSHILPPNPGWRENVAAAVEAGGLASIVELLKKHPKDLEMLRSATNGLSGLTTNAENAGQLAKAGGVESALQAMLGLSAGDAATMDGQEVADAGSRLLEKVAQYNPGAILDSKGGVEAVLDGLVKSTNDRVKAACATVTDRVGMGERGQKALLSKGALEAMVKAIGPGVETTEDVLKPTFRLLERFAKDPKIVKKMKDLGLVEALVLQLEAHSGNEALLRAGGRLLAKVAGDDLEAAIERLKRGGLSEEAREFTTALLANLALSPENVERIVLNGGVAVLINNFGQFSEKSQIAAARALGRLAMNKATAAEIIQKGGVEVLVEAMRHNPDNEELVAACTQALSNLATSSKENAAAVDAKGGIKEVLEALKRHPESETNAQAALAMVQQLASIGFDAAKLTDMGAVEAILAAMAANLNSADVQRSGFRGLTALMAHEPAGSKMLKPAAVAILSDKSGLGTMINALEIHRSRDIVVVPAVECFAVMLDKERTAADRLKKAGAAESVVSAVFSQMLAAALGSVQAAGALSGALENNVRTILSALVKKEQATARAKGIAAEAAGAASGKEPAAEALESSLMAVAVYAKDPTLARALLQGGAGAGLAPALRSLVDKQGLPMQNQLMAAFALAAGSLARAGPEFLGALDQAGTGRVLVDAIKKHAQATESTICCMRAMRAMATTQPQREKLVADGAIEGCVGAMRSNAEQPFVALAALDVFLSLSSSDALCSEVAFKGGTRQAIKMIQDSASSEEFERPTERALMVMDRVAASKGADADDIRSNLVKQGAVDATTKAMSSYPWSEQIEAVGARLLSRLLDAQGVQAEIEKMAALVAELKKAPRPEAVLPKLARSMATVGALALTPANTPVMVKLGAADIVIDALRKIAKLELTKEREYARRAGFRALGQLASVSPLPGSSGANELISDALSAPVSKVTLIEKSGVLDCIKSMAVVESAAAALVGAGVVPLVVDLVREHSHDEALVTAAFGALAALAAHQAGAKACTSAGCVALAMELMRNFHESCEPRFSEEAMLLLANLALIESNIKPMLDGGAVDLVTSALDHQCDDPASPEPRVLTAAVALLQRLAVSEANIRAIVRSGAVRKVLQIASSSVAYQSDAECMEAVLFLVETCALVPETHEALVKAGAVDVIMSAMQLNATNENVAVTGSKALQALLGSSSDTVKVLLDEVAKLAAALKKRPGDRDLQAQLTTALRNLGNLALVKGVVSAKAAGEVAKTAVDAMDTVQGAVEPGPSKQALLMAAIQMLGRAALIDGGKVDADKAVRKLLQIIEANRGDDAVLESAMYALGNLASNPAAVKALGAAGGVALLERTIKEAAGNERLRDAAARALEKVRITAAAGATALASDPAGANVLAQVLQAHSDDPTAMRDFLEEVGSGKSGVANLMAILGAGAFVGAQPHVRAALLRALQERLAAGGGDLKVTSDADMAALLAGLDERTEGLSKGDRAAALERQKATVRLLGHLNAGSAAAFAKAGGVDKLLELMRQNPDDADANAAAMRALANMASDKKVAGRLVEQDAAAAALAAMKAHPDDEAVQHAGVNLLTRLADARGVGKAGMTAETMRLVNRAVENFGAGNPDIKRNGGKLVDGLSGIYKEESSDMVGARLEGLLGAMAGADHIKELYDDKGRRYYYNTKTGQTSFDVPPEVRDAAAAAAALSKLTESHKDNVQDVDPAALAGAIKQLEEHGDEPARLVGLTQALGVLASNEKNRDEIARVGGLEAIIAALTGENVDPEFLAAAIHLLNQFARNDYFKEQISKLGGIEALILIMLKYMAHLNVVEKCVSTLANLAYNSPVNMGEIVKYDGVDAVSKAMATYSKEPALLNFAMILLSNLMYGNDDHKLLIGRKVGLQIIGVTRDHFRDPKLFKGALRALGNLSYCDENILAIVSNGATKCIVAGMAAHEDDVEAQQIAIEVIGNFASFSEDDPAVRRRIERGEQSSVYDMIVVEGGAKRILETVSKTEEPALMMSGIEALSNLANNAVVTEKLIHMGVVDAVFYAMQKYDWDEDLMERCMRLVAILTYSPAGVKAIGAANGVQTILNAMEAHEDQPDFLANAAAALKNIAADDALREEVGRLGGIKTVLSLFEKNMSAQNFLLEAVTLFIRLTRAEHLSEEIASKGMNVILEAIDQHKNDIDFLVPGFTLLGHLAFAHSNLKIITQFGGVDVIIASILEHPESKNLVIRCVQTLDNIAMASVEHSRIVIDAQGQETIREVMAAYKGDAEVEQVCKSALLSMQPTVERRRAKPRNVFGDQHAEAGPSQEDPLATVRNMLKSGAVFTEWSGGGPHSRHVLVKPDFKSLAWRDPRKPRAEMTVQLRDVRNVRSGLHDGHKQRRRQADPKKAFSIICRATSIDLEAPTEADKDRWVAALAELLRVYKNEPQWLR